MTVETIGKMDFTSQQWAEIFGLCELLFEGLCEVYSQRKPDQQRALGVAQFDFLKILCYNIITERKKNLSVKPFHEAANPPFITKLAPPQTKIFQIFWTN